MTTQYTTNFQLALPDFRSGPWHDLVNIDFSRIDALLYSAMSQGNVAPWTNATAYTPGITVIDNSDASVWVCAVPHTSAVLPTTFLADRTAHPTYWARLLTGFAPRGEWARSTQYFPYDLTYDSARGIMALCQTIHISTSTGSILDDSSHWAFLLDMSDVGIIIASAVSYSNTASSIPGTNVQNAIDYVQSEIVSLNNVNITQGTQITNLGTVNNTQDSRLSSLESRVTATESVNGTQNTQIASLAAVPPVIPSGAITVFYMAVAPVGWNKVVLGTDYMMRVLNVGGTSAGAISFTTWYNTTLDGAVTLDVNTTAYHYHLGIPADSGYATGPYVYTGAGSINYIYGQTNSAAFGNGGYHQHGINNQVAHLDMILCQKS